MSTPQENLEIMTKDIIAIRQQVSSIRRHLIVIAIPFWLSLIGFLLFCGFCAIIIFEMAGQ